MRDFEGRREVRRVDLAFCILLRVTSRCAPRSAEKATNAYRGDEAHHAEDHERISTPAQNELNAAMGEPNMDGVSC